MENICRRQVILLLQTLKPDPCSRICLTINVVVQLLKRNDLGCETIENIWIGAPSITRMKLGCDQLQTCFDVPVSNWRVSREPNAMLLLCRQDG